MMICLGDLIGYYHQSLEVLDEIMPQKMSIIMGNHEAFAIDKLSYSKKKGELINIDYVRKGMSSRQRDWIKSLPLSLEINAGAIKLNCYHGSPWSPLEEYIYPDYPDFDRFAGFNCQYILLGHTHYPLIKKAGQVTVINPGSCGQPRDGDHRASAVILDTVKGHAEFLRIDYDIAHFLADAKKHGVSEELL